jgi:transcriptional regulator with XRE-family HTH domain
MSAPWFDGHVAWWRRSDEDDPSIEFGRWLAEARRLAGFSQAALGDRVGVSQSSISRLERGLVPAARLSTVAPLLIFLRAELAAAERTRQAMRRAG